MQVMRPLLCLLIASSTIASGYTNLAIVNTLSVGDLRSAAPAPSYTNLALDNFTTQEASPIATPRSAEPGPGTWSIIQSDSSFWISNTPYLGESFGPGSALIASRQTNTATAGNLRLISTNAISTNAGLCMIAKVRLSDNTAALGFERTTVSGSIDGAAWNISGSVAISARFNGVDFSGWGGALRRNTDWEFSMVLRKGGGAYALVRGGHYTKDSPSTAGWPDWRLYFVDTTFKDSSVWPAIDAMDATNTWVDAVRVMQLGSEWDNPYYLSSASYIGASDGISTNMPFNAIIENTFLHLTNVNDEIRFRVVNPTNYWAYRMNQTNGNVTLIEAIDGTETERRSLSPTYWGATNTLHRITIICYGSYITVYDGVGSPSYAAWTTAPFLTNTDYSCSVSGTGSNLVVWPILQNISLGPLTPTIKTLAFGDSVYNGAYDTNVPSGSLSGFGRYLMDSVNTNNVISLENLWCSLNSATVSNLASVVDGYIQKVPDVPSYILVNMGYNDVARLSLDETFTNNYAYCLDALHARWPGTPVYIQGFWCKVATQRDAIRGLAAQCIAARSDWCHAGPDAAIFLENGDNGATYMNDDVHPNQAGYILTAQKWRETLGL